jgi:transposase
MGESPRQAAALNRERLYFALSYKRLEKGRFLWPSPADGTVAISPAQMAYMLDGIDWRNPRQTFRPERAG